jgi:aryl sulfotransferase
MDRPDDAMTPNPHVLVLGYPKCGNVWLRSLMADLLKAGGVPFRQVMENHPVAPAMEQLDLGIREQARQDQVRFTPLRAYQEIPGVFSWAIPDIGDYAASTSMAHSHSPWSPGIAPFVDAFSHRVLIIRDPRDVAVSWSRWMFTPFNRLHRPTLHETPDALLRGDLRIRVTEWDAHQHGWLHEQAGSSPLHVVFYERLVADTPGELARIAAYLGLRISRSLLEEIAGRSSLSEMKKRQPHHIHRGGWGTWRDHLEERQVLEVRKVCGGMMRSLGYPLDRGEAETWSPDCLRVSEAS